MHGLVAIERGGATLATSAPAARIVPASPPAPAPIPEAGHYGGRDRFNWIAIVTIVISHGLLLAALVKMDVIEIGPKAPPPLVVDLVTLAPPPPPPPPSTPDPEVAPVKPVQPLVVAPPPVVETPAPPPQLAIAAAPPPPQAVVVAARPAAAASSAPVAVDLSTRMISGEPPRYPIESRRKHEEGTVVLHLLLGVDGRVAEVSVARSSGFARLDKAALDAARRWRWTPTVQAGQPVQVRGTFDVPFVLG